MDRHRKIDAKVYSAGTDKKEFTDTRKYDMLLTTQSAGRGVLIGTQNDQPSSIIVKDDTVRVNASNMEVMGTLNLQPAALRMKDGFVIDQDLEVRGKDGLSVQGPLRAAQGSLIVNDKQTTVSRNIVGNCNLSVGCNLIIGGNLDLKGKIVNTSVDVNDIDVGGRADVAGEFAVRGGSKNVDGVVEGDMFRVSAFDAVHDGNGNGGYGVEALASMRVRDDFLSEGPVRFTRGSFVVTDESANFGNRDIFNVSKDRVSVSRDLLSGGDLDVKGDAEVEGYTRLLRGLEVKKPRNENEDPVALRVDGDTKLLGSIEIVPNHRSITASTAFIVDNVSLTARRNADLRSNLSVDGVSLLRGGLRVHSSSSSMINTETSPAFEVESSRVVSRKTFDILKSDLHVGGAARVAGDLSVGANQEGKEAAFLVPSSERPLGKRNIDVRRHLDVRCNLDVRGGATVRGSLDVAAQADLRDGLRVTGGTDIEAGALRVSPVGAYSGGSNVLAFEASDARIAALRDMFVDGNLTVRNRGDLRLTDGNLQVIGEAEVKGDFSATNSFFKVRERSSKEGFHIELGENASAQKNLRVLGTTDLRGALHVNAGGQPPDRSNVMSVSDAGVDVRRNLSVRGAELHVRGDSTVIGCFRVTNPQNVELLTVTGGVEDSVKIGKQLSVQGLTRVEGGGFEVDLGGSLALELREPFLNVNRRSSFGCNLEVGGDAVFRGNKITFVPGDPGSRQSQGGIVLDADARSIKAYRDLDARKDLSVGGNARVRGSFRVNPGDRDVLSVSSQPGSSIGGKFVVDGADAVFSRGDVDLTGGDLGVVGKLTVRPGGVDVLRATEDRIKMSRRLEVLGGQELTGELAVYPNSRATSSGLPALYVSDTMSTNTATIDLNRNVLATCNLTVRGDWTTDGNAFVGKTLRVDKDAEIANDLRILGESTLTGRAECKSGLVVTRDAGGPTLLTVEHRDGKDAVEVDAHRVDVRTGDRSGGTGSFRVRGDADVYRGKLRVLFDEEDNDAAAILVAENTGIDLNRDLSVRGDVRLAQGGLTVIPSVRADTTAEPSVAFSVSDSLVSIDRHARLDCNLDVERDFSVRGDARVEGSLEVAEGGAEIKGGDLLVRKDLRVQGEALFSGASMRLTDGDVHVASFDRFSGADIATDLRVAEGLRVSRGNLTVEAGELSVAPRGDGGTTSAFRVNEDAVDVRRRFTVRDGNACELTGDVIVRGQGVQDVRNATAEFSTNRVLMRRNLIASSNLNVGGRFSVEGNRTTLEEELQVFATDVSGTGMRTSAFRVTQPEVRVDRRLHASCNVFVGGDLFVGGNVTSDKLQMNDLLVNGDGVLTGDLEIGEGTMSINRDFVTIRPDAAVRSNLEVGNDMYVGGDVSTLGTLAIRPGGCNAQAALSVTAGLTTIDTDIEASSNLTVGRDVSLGRDLSVARNAEIGGGATVAGGELVARRGLLVEGDRVAIETSDLVMRPDGGIEVFRLSDENMTVQRPLSVTGDTDITGKLTVTEGGVVSLAVDESTATVNRDLDVNGQFEATGEGRIGEDLHVGGNIYGDRNMILEDKLTLRRIESSILDNSDQSNLLIKTNMSVTPSGKSDPTFELKGNDMIVNADAEIQGNLRVEEGDLHVVIGGQSRFRVTESNVFCSEDLQLGGDLVVGDTLRVMEDVVIGGDVSMSGDSVLRASSNLIRARELDIGSGGFVSQGRGDVRGGGGFTVRPSSESDAAMLDVREDGLDIGGDLEVEGDLHLRGEARMEGALEVFVNSNLALSSGSGGTDVRGGLRVEGGGTSLFGGDLEVRTAADGDPNGDAGLALNDQLLSVNRDAGVSGDVTVGGGLTVQEDAEIRGDLDVVGALDLGGSLDLGSNLVVQGTADLNCNLIVRTGDLEILAFRVAHDRIDARRNVRAESNLTVGKDASIKGDADVEGGLEVIGDVDFSGKLTMISDQIRAAAGLDTESEPAYSWTGDHGTGVFRPADGVIAFASSGQEKARLTSSGDFGIGVQDPEAKLDVDGGVRAAGQIASDDGSSSAPTYTFTAASNTGIYRTDDGSVAVSIEGGQELTVTSAGTFVSDALTVNDQVRGYSDGDEMRPTFSFITDDDTGIYRAGQDALGFSTGGAERVRVGAQGNVGIGTTNASDGSGVRLDVGGGGVRTTGQIFASPAFATAAAPSVTWTDDTDTGMYRRGPDTVCISTDGQERVCVTDEGKIGMNVPFPEARLHVEGDLRASDQITTFDGSVQNPSFAFVSHPDTGMYLTEVDNGDDEDADVDVRFSLKGQDRLTVRREGTGVLTSSPNATLHVAGDANIGGLRIVTVNVDFLPMDEGDFVEVLEILNDGRASTVRLDVCDDEHDPDTLASTYLYTVPRFLGTSDEPRLLLPLSRACSGDLEQQRIDPYQVQVGSTGAVGTVMFRLVRTGTGSSFSGPIRCTFFVSGSDHTDDVIRIGSLSGSNTEVLGDSDRSRIANAAQITQISASDRQAFVGMGVVYPQHKLHVAGGDARVEGDVYALITRGEKDASVDLPTYTFEGDDDTGMYRPDENEISFALGGVEALRLTQGLCGIGKSDPQQVLDVQGNIRASDGRIFAGDDGSASAPSFSWTDDTDTGIFRPGDDEISLTTSGANRLRVDAQGNIGINTTDPEARLHVDGDIRATNQIVTFEGTNSEPAFGFTSSPDTGFFLDRRDDDDDEVAVELSLQSSVHASFAPGGLGLFTREPNAELHVNGAANVDGHRMFTVIVDPLPTVEGRFAEIFRIGDTGKGAVVRIDVTDGPWNDSLSSTYLYATGKLFNGEPNELLLPVSRATSGVYSKETAHPYQLQVGGDSEELRFWLVRTAAGADYSTHRGPITCTVSVSGCPSDDHSMIEPGPVYDPDSNVFDVIDENDTPRLNNSTQLTQVSAENRAAYVGIGVSDPQHKLHVAGGDTRMEGDLYVLLVRGEKDASAEAPTFSFEGDENTGLYRPAENELALSSDGSNMVRLKAGSGRLGVGKDDPEERLDVQGNVRASAGRFIAGDSGSMGANSFTWVGDQDTGMYRPDPNSVAFSTSGLERMIVKPDGRVGINQYDPDAQFHVDGNVHATDQILTFDGSIEYPAFGFTRSSNTGLYAFGASNLQMGLSREGSLHTCFTSNGVGVFTGEPDSELHVAGDANIDGHRIITVEVQDLPVESQRTVELLEIEDRSSGGQGGLRPWATTVQLEVCDSREENQAPVSSTYSYVVSRFFLGFEDNQLLLPVSRTVDGAYGPPTADPYQVQVGPGDSGDGSLRFLLVRTNTGSIFTGPIRCVFRVSGSPGHDPHVFHAGPRQVSDTPVIFSSQRDRTANSTQVTQISANDRQAYVGIGEPDPQHRLHVAGSVMIDSNLEVEEDAEFRGRIAVMNGATSGGLQGRGIHMNTLDDTDWGIYLNDKSLTNDSQDAVSGDGFSGPSLRMRVRDTNNGGFVMENSDDARLISVRGSDARTSVQGHAFLKSNLEVGGRAHLLSNLVVENDSIHRGKIVVMDGMTTGNTINRGIHFNTVQDSSWGLYTHRDRSLSGQSAVSGEGFGSTATRLRVPDNADNGFLIENSSEARLLSVRGSDGFTGINGRLQVNDNVQMMSNLFVEKDTVHRGKIVVMDGSTSGSTGGRGIHFNTVNDTNWGLYLNNDTSLSGASAVSGRGFNSTSARLRVRASQNNGFILENSSEQLLMSVRGDGFANFNSDVRIGGNLSTDGTSIQNLMHRISTLENHVSDLKGKVDSSVVGKHGVSGFSNSGYTFVGDVVMFWFKYSPSGNTSSLTVPSDLFSQVRNVMMTPDGDLSGSVSDSRWNCRATITGNLTVDMHHASRERPLMVFITGVKAN